MNEMINATIAQNSMRYLLTPGSASYGPTLGPIM
jgi:hypothetical protein